MWIRLVSALLLVAGLGLGLYSFNRRSADGVGLREAGMEGAGAQGPKVIGRAERDSDRGGPGGRTEGGEDAGMLAQKAASADAISKEIDSVLRDEAVEAGAAAEKLIAIAADRGAPKKSRLEALEHGLNLLDDGDYSMAREVIEDAETPEAMLESLMFDLRGREDRVLLETSLELAQKEGHPLAGEAQEVLSFFIDEEYGNDWGAWKRAVEEYLKGVE